MLKKKTEGNFMSNILFLVVSWFFFFFDFGKSIKKFKEKMEVIRSVYRGNEMFVFVGNWIYEEEEEESVHCLIKDKE
jgi:preprotein translocase subunit YajC